MADVSERFTGIAAMVCGFQQEELADLTEKMLAGGGCIWHPQYSVEHPNVIICGNTADTTFRVSCKRWWHRRQQLVSAGKQPCPAGPGAKAMTVEVPVPHSC